MAESFIGSIENKVDKCVVIDLDSAPYNRGSLPIKLTALFNQARKKIKMGSFCYGPREGSLTLRLTNAVAPLDHRRFSAPIEELLDVDNEVTSEVKASKKHSLQGSSGIGLEATGVKADLSLKAQATRGSTRTLSHKKAFKSKRYLATSFGDSTAPGWRFVSTRDVSLAGKISKKELCRLEVGGKSCKIDVTFEVEPSDLVLTDGTGLIPAGIGPNRSGVIRAFLLSGLRKNHGRVWSKGSFVYER